MVWEGKNVVKMAADARRDQSTGLSPQKILCFFLNLLLIFRHEVSLKFKFG